MNSVAIVLFWPVIWLAVGAPAGAGQPPSRDAVWRSIFARPAEAQPEHQTTDPVLKARIALGHDLFRDTRLSGDGDRSCASCHRPERAFADGLAKGAARDGRDLPRNTPGLFNVRWGASFFWDGRAPTLELQARVPLTAPDEMAGRFDEIEARLGLDPDMVRRFAAAFPESTSIGEANVLAAIAAYERTLVSPVTRFDRWVEGDDAALSDAELEGFRLFVGRAGCVGCHGGWRFTDDGFHDIGLPGADLGRGGLPGGAGGPFQFKTPSLREAVHTGPYMHDGSIASLREVVVHYSEGVSPRPSVDSNIVRNLRLTGAEIDAIVAFLASLSSE